MKKLIITRGLPGSGKSTTLDQSRLKDFTISTDQLRNLYSSPVMLSNGKMSISQDVNHKIWPILFNILEDRMSQGATTVVDAVHPSLSDFNQYLSLAKKYNYEVACLDFTEVPIEFSEWTNAGRAEYAIVPNTVIEKFSKLIDESPPLPEEVKIIKVRADRSHIEEINSWLMPDIMNLSNYKEIIHVGDIQGCFDPLQELLSDGLDPEKFYIFVGDFCDRGEQNAEVVRFLVDNVIGKPNVVTLVGNHEYHIFRDIAGQEPVSDEYKLFTRKHFDSHNITQDDLRKLVYNIRDVFFYSYNDKRVMVSHGGLPNIPKYPWMIMSKQYEKGVGYYEEDVDTTFNKTTSEQWYQVHGHRNIQKHPIIFGRSMNLEGQVEFGGHLRVSVLDKDGFRAQEYKNNNVRKWRDRLKRKSEIIPRWMTEEDNGQNTRMSVEVFESLREHEGVKERITDSYPFISSMNFTKEVFYNKSWDSVSNKARGLCIDSGAGETYLEIVARSYEKFSTINENPKMLIDNFVGQIAFPAVGRMKENGFLGITGYIARTDELFISTKGSPEGDFADIFKDLYHKTFSNAQAEKMKIMMKELECSFIFEVIEPQLDPHMVKYEEPKLVLLDVVRRSMVFETLDYKQLLKVGEMFDVEVAPEMITLKNELAFRKWFESNSHNMKNEYEGLVWRDSNGLMFKTKNPFYSFWKLMRGTKDAILREKKNLSAEIPKNIVSQFLKRTEKIDCINFQDVIDKYISDITYDSVPNMLEELDGRQDSYKITSVINNTLAYKGKTVSRQSMRDFLKTRDLEFVADEADAFKNWCFELPVEVLGQDIITVREIYKSEQQELVTQNIKSKNKSFDM